MWVHFKLSHLVIARLRGTKQTKQSGNICKPNCFALLAMTVHHKSDKLKCTRYMVKSFLRRYE